MDFTEFFIGFSIVIPTVVLFLVGIPDIIGIIFLPCHAVEDITQVMPGYCSILEWIFKIGDIIMFIFGCFLIFDSFRH